MRQPSRLGRNAAASCPIAHVVRDAAHSLGAPDVSGAIDLTHSAGADRRDDFS
jgi:hypothetical protein